MPPPGPLTKRGMAASAWQRVTLPNLSRAFRTPKVLDERVELKGYEGTLRQVILRFGKYHDVRVYSILREEYLEMQKK